MGPTTVHLFDRAARVWWQPGEREPERGAERINIRARIDRAASKLLRAREIRCADKFSVRQDDVARLQFAMNQTRVRSRNECPRNLHRNFQRWFCLKRSIAPYPSL